jgi:hypothetical protein
MNSWKKEGPGGGQAQGVADPKNWLILNLHFYSFQTAAWLPDFCRYKRWENIPNGNKEYQNAIKAF